MVDDIITLSLTDKDYSPLLKEIHEPPQLLYVRGNLDILSYQPMLAVVGSRKASVYGKQVTDHLLPPIVQAGIPLVSGLAYGIDSMAHNVCLSHHTPTIAVLGSGINDTAIYPRRHLQLAHDIIDSGGAIISEYPPDTPPLPHHFPERNRLIAGLTQATLIIQAARRSGSLITARLALESDRDVAAVPGAITDRLAEGTNLLIQQGATPILCPQDIFDLFNLSPTVTTNSTTNDNLTDNQQKIISSLSTTPRHIDQIAALAALPSSTVSIALTELELIDVVEHVGNMKYIKK